MSTKRERRGNITVFKSTRDDVPMDYTGTVEIEGKAYDIQLYKTTSAQGLLYLKGPVYDPPVPTEEESVDF